ncbi:anti-repressor SinI family protein [Virgibacillus siamensis]|nr:anti-repressor SinI family protein [Virgibacillus siamensis]
MGSAVEKIEVDYEWLELIKQAKTIGLTAEEIRLFLAKARRDTT